MLNADLLLEKIICFNKYLCLSGLKKKSSWFSRKKKKIHKVYNILFALVFCFTCKVNFHYRPLVLSNWILHWAMQNWNWPITHDSKRAIRNIVNFRKWNFIWKLASNFMGNKQKEIVKRGWKTECEEMGKKLGI